MRTKFTVTTSLTALVALLAMGWSSWGAVAWGRLTKAVENAVPVTVELERIEHMATGMSPEIEAGVTRVAELEIAVRDQRQRVSKLDDRQLERKAALRSLRDSLRGAPESIVFGQRHYTPSEVRAELENRFAIFQRAAQELEAQRALLEAKRDSLAASESRLAALRRRLQELELARQQLAARHELLQAKNTANQLALDDSAMTRAEAALARLKRRLDVSEAAARRQGLEADQSEGRIPVEPEVGRRDLLEQLDTVLGEPQ